jgi:hypothetical protein
MDFCGVDNELSYGASLVPTSISSYLTTRQSASKGFSTLLVKRTVRSTIEALERWAIGSPDVAAADVAPTLVELDGEHPNRARAVAHLAQIHNAGAASSLREKIDAIDDKLFERFEKLTDRNKLELRRQFAEDLARRERRMSGEAESNGGSQVNIHLPTTASAQVVDPQTGLTDVERQRVLEHLQTVTQVAKDQEPTDATPPR